MDEDREEGSGTKLARDSDDSCSICLDAFSKRNPSTEADCKHEFHLKCLLDGCGRSSNCPICSQTIRLKQPVSRSQFRMTEISRRRWLKKTKSAATPPVGVDSANAGASSSVAPNELQSSSLKSGQKAKPVSPLFSDPSPKKLKVEEASDPPKEGVTRDGFRSEALNMLPNYMATVAKTINKSVGTREAEKLLNKSDGNVLQSSVSHLMKATVLMAEYTHRMADLNGETRKTIRELDSARREIDLLRIENKKNMEKLGRDRMEMAALRREKANAVKRAAGAGQAKLKLQVELIGLEAEVEKLKADVSIKEAEAATAIESFKNSKDFCDLKQEWRRKGEESASGLMRKELNEARAEIYKLRKEKQNAINRTSQVEQEMVEVRKERQNAVDRAGQVEQEIVKVCKEKQNAVDRASQVEEEMVKLKTELKKLWQQ